MLPTAVSFLSSQVATDVINEFAADGVKYLELRSTPREEKHTGGEAALYLRSDLLSRLFY